MSFPPAVPATTAPPSASAAITVSSGQGPSNGAATFASVSAAVGGTGGPSTGHQSQGSRPLSSGQGQLAQLLQQAHLGSKSNAAATLSSTIAASGLVLLPPPPLTSKNLTIHTSLLSTKQQLLQQQQQLQQLHHAQLNAALKKQQQNHQRNLQREHLQQQLHQQQQPCGRQPLSTEDCSPSVFSDSTMMGECEREGESGLPRGCAIGHGHGGEPDVVSRSTSGIASPASGGANPSIHASPGVPLMNAQGDSAFDHYPPPDQWNYTMTRYHASLIPLCQIEEPPTFYEGMDDHPPVNATDNDNNNGIELENDGSFFLKARNNLRNGEKDRGRDKDRDRGRDISRDMDKDRSYVINEVDKMDCCSVDAKPNYPHPRNDIHDPVHGHGFQHAQEQHSLLQDQTQQGELVADEGNDVHLQQGQFKRESVSSNLHHHHHEVNHNATEDSENKQDSSNAIAKHQKRRERTLGSSGEQIFFYDGPNLIHSKLYSDTQDDLKDRSKRASISEGMTVVDRDSNSRDVGPRAINRKTTITKKLRSRSQSRSRPRSRSRPWSRSKSRSRSRSVNRNSMGSSPSKSPSGSTSDSWSRMMSESMTRKEKQYQKQQQQQQQQFPSSFPSARTRPSILMRGFSADSSSRLDQDQQRAREGSGNGSVNGNGSIHRKATAKEKFVAMVTRGTGTLTLSPSGRDSGSSSAYDNSQKMKIHRNSMDERSSPRLVHSVILSQTHSRRQGSPLLGRGSGFHDQSGMSNNTIPPVTDAMMGFPYNNSSLLVSTDLARSTQSKASPVLRTTRSNRPRPFSVATMEKIMASSSSRSDGYGPNFKEDSPRHDKFRSSMDGRQEPVTQFPHRQKLQSQPALNMDTFSWAEHGNTSSQIVPSGSHPMQTTLSCSLDNTSSSLDGKKIKGKDIERSSETELFNAATTTEPTKDDLTTSSNSAPVHVHEHHIHHHYYCQHYPPLVSPSTDDGLVPQDPRHYSASVGHRRRPDSTPLLPTMGSSDSRQRRAPLVDTGFSLSPTTSEHRHSFAAGNELYSRSKPIAVVNNKKKSILGTMSMTSTMRKRFFAEQKKQHQAQEHTQEGQGTSKHQVLPLSSHVLSGYDKDGRAHGPEDAIIRGGRNQRRIPLDGLSDEEDYEYGQLEKVSTADNGSSGQPEQLRAKFLSRLKRFLLRPSPFAKGSSPASNEAQSGMSNSTPTTPLETRSAATVRVTKTRWSHSGNNLPDHFMEDDMDFDKFSSDNQLMYYPSQKEVRRWTHQDIFNPPAAMTQRRKKIDIRSQFQQQQQQQQQKKTLPQEIHTHHHHHHHHHDLPSHNHHSHSVESTSQHPQHPSLQQQQPLHPLQQQPNAPHAAPIAVSKDLRSTDSIGHRSPKSAVTSILSSLPRSTSTHDKDLSDHDTSLTPCSASPVTLVATNKEVSTSQLAVT